MSERKRTILLWVLAIAILAAIVLALFATGFFDAISSQEKLEAYIQASTPWSHLVFFGVQLVSVVIAPIPSNITAAVGGVLFGMIPAFLLTWGAVVLGSVIVFLLARVLGRWVFPAAAGLLLAARAGQEQFFFSMSGADFAAGTVDRDETGAQVLTLSTCLTSYGSGLERYVVHAYRES